VDDTAKNLVDVILTILTMLGAGVAFCFGLHQWRRAQAFQRAEQLNKFIEKFETDELLRLATLVIDWSDRETLFRGEPFTFWNDDALLALRDHTKITERPMFTKEQAALRDAYDAFLAFVTRLQIGISTKLIEKDAAEVYFAYWLNHFINFDKHRDDGNLFQGTSPAVKVAEYIKAYGDPPSINELCNTFSIVPPVTLILKTGETEAINTTQPRTQEEISSQS